MKTFEALACLMAARDGMRPHKTKAVEQYGEASKQALRQMGMKNKQLYEEYPDKELRNGIFLVSNHPLIFAEQARASAAWLISRN